ncbi:MAG TPA: DUF2065 family protein [Candidatus Gracilibacteria bacterium]
MEVTNTTLITAIVGLVWLGMGIAFVLNPKEIQNAMDKFFKDPSSMFVAGIFSMILGSILMVSHWKWGTSWESLISAVGIASFIKGIAYVGFPSHMVKMKHHMISTQGGIRGWGILLVLLGLVFLYLSVF